MNTEMNLCVPIFAGETAPAGQGLSNALQALPDEASPFQLLLFQSLGKISQREMTDQSSERPGDSSKEFPEGMNGLFLAGQALPPAVITGESGSGTNSSGTGEQAVAAVPISVSIEEPARVPQRGGLQEGMLTGSEAIKTDVPILGMAIESASEQRSFEGPEEGFKITEKTEVLKSPTGPELLMKKPGAGEEGPGLTKAADSPKEPLKAEVGRIAERAPGPEKPKTQRESKDPPPVHAAAAPRDAQLGKPLVRAPEKLEAYSQIGREIQLKLEQKGPMEFKMQLEPKDLGQIDIKLKISEGKLVIDIMAASSKTQALLAGQADKLVMSMGLQNVRVESVQVNQQGDQQSGERQGQAFLMNGETNFSDGRQQGRFPQQPANRQNGPGAIGSRYESIETDGVGSSRQGGVQRSNFGRMDYSI